MWRRIWCGISTGHAGWKEIEPETYLTDWGRTGYRYRGQCPRCGAIWVFAYCDGVSTEERLTGRPLTANEAVAQKAARMAKPRSWFQRLRDGIANGS